MQWIRHIFHKKNISPVICGLALAYIVGHPIRAHIHHTDNTIIPWNHFIVGAQDKNIHNIYIQGNMVSGETLDGHHDVSYSVSAEHAATTMDAHNIPYNVKPLPNTNNMASMIIQMCIGILPLIPLFIILKRGNKLPFMQRMPGTIVYPKQLQSELSLDDIIIDAEAHAEIREVIHSIQHPAKYTRMGATTPKGILLSGPPGVGKTALAKAIAKETNATFIETNGSAFIQMLAGSGTHSIRHMIAIAKKHTPCIIFIDEIDSIARMRTTHAHHPSNQEQESTLNTLLSEMDGFSNNEYVTFIAATNRSDILDPAITRSGRFDKHILLSYPTYIQRIRIFTTHMDTKQHSIESWDTMARKTSGMSGADIKNVCNAAAIMAVREDAACVTTEHITTAINRMLMGTTRESLIMQPKEREAVAIHEAGHTVALITTHHTGQIDFTTILPRNKSLGLTVIHPMEDSHLQSKAYLMDTLVVLMAGRAAEISMLEPLDITNGAAKDIEEATRLAHKMVVYWGMGTRTQHISYLDDSPPDTTPINNSHVQEDIADILRDAMDRAIHIIHTHQNAVLAIKDYLLIHEEIQGKIAIQFVQDYA